MDCIYAEYIKFVNNFLVEYYKELLGVKYERALVRPFIDKFIDVRYYNRYSVKEDDFTERLNKELNTLAKGLMKDHKSKAETIKDIFALFSYVLFIDGCTHFSDINALLKALFTDDTISLNYSSETKKTVTASVKGYINKKLEFFKVFNTQEFYLKGKRYSGDVFHIDLGQKINLPKLYSDYAIKKAYNSDVVFENRIYLTLIMLSSKILFDVLSLKFENTYVVDFPETLFEKPKKIMKFTNAINDDYLKEKISFKIKYKQYKHYKRTVHELINRGYGITLELDDTYTTNFDNLFLFTNIIVDKKYNYYDIIINNRDAIKTNIITL